MISSLVYVVFYFGIFLHLDVHCMSTLCGLGRGVDIRLNGSEGEYRGDGQDNKRLSDYAWNGRIGYDRRKVLTERVD